MKLDQALVDAAIGLVRIRYGGDAAWQGAAALYTATGKVLTSTFVDSPNPAVSLCHETGAICEAHKLGEKVTASVCVSRAEDGSFHILTPCGVCQERLYFWGADVQVAVPVTGDPAQWQAKTLQDVQPFYWYKPYQR